jgi:ABC-2 type transport system permease protein
MSTIFRFQPPHHSAYALAGLALWNFFAQTTTGAMSELSWGGNLMNKIYLPRSIFAVTALGTSLINLLLTLMYHLIEIFRAPLLIGWLAGPNTVLASVVAAFVTLAVGWWYFSRKTDELAYRI